MQIYCRKILMADEPGIVVSIDRFHRPFYIAIRYQNFARVAPAGRKSLLVKPVEEKQLEQKVKAVFPGKYLEKSFG